MDPGQDVQLDVMGQCFATPVGTLNGANGALVVGSRMQTQYTFDEGGDGMWYTGTITGLYTNGIADVRYDDGDKWSGLSLYCYLLPNGSPGLTQPQPYGVPSQGLHVMPPGGYSGTVVASATPVAIATPMVGIVAPSGPTLTGVTKTVVGRPL